MPVLDFDNPWWLIITALHWLGERSGVGNPTPAQRRAWLEDIQRAASQDGQVRVTGRYLPLPGYELQDGVVWHRRGLFSFPVDFDPQIPDSERRIIPAPGFIDGRIRRFHDNPDWWLINDDDAVFGWRDLRLLAADVRRIWPDADTPVESAVLVQKQQRRGPKPKESPKDMARAVALARSNGGDAYKAAAALYEEVYPPPGEGASPAECDLWHKERRRFIKRIHRRLTENPQNP